MDMFDIIGKIEFISLLRTAAEIGILFFVIYGVLYYLRGTRGSFVLLGGVTLWFILWFAADRLGLKVISHLFNVITVALPVVLVVLFQPELRRLLAQLGSYAFWRRRRREMIGEIVTAACNMAHRKCGALIVMERRIHLQGVVEDAVALDDRVNSLLLEAIFYPNAPLHDGAVVVRGDRIIAARAILPLTRSKDVSPQLGTRHRAALGVSEDSDAVVIVVSEETGTISIAVRGVLHRDLDAEALRTMLEKLLVERDEDEFSETAKLIAETQIEQDPSVEEEEKGGEA